jgi:acetylornithine deacetylase/succinyl-diaminopimelate desuccinylase-like protein
LGARWLVEKHREVVEGCEEAIGEVGGFSLTVRDDLRLYPIQTAEKGMAWLNLIAEGRAGHGSLRHDENAITALSAAVARVGSYQWPRKITDPQRAFLEAVAEAFEVDLDPDQLEETLAHLGSIARLIGATMSNTANPTMLTAGYKHNVIPGNAAAAIDGRFLPGSEDEFYATIADLIGDQVRYEVVAHNPSVETQFAGALVEAMQACLEAEDPGAQTVPYLFSGGTDGKAWHSVGIRCFGFAPLRLPPDLDFVGMFHGVDERVPTDSLEFGARVLDRFLDRA